MRTSSKNTRTNLRRNWQRTSFIRAWKVSGVLVNPKGMTSDSKCSERRLLNILRVHPHLMVARAEVKLGEEASTVQFV